MFTSIATTIEQIANKINNTKPLTWPDRGFVCSKLAVGEDLEDWIRKADARRLRECVLRVTSLPTIGSSLCYLTGEITLEIAYPCSIPEDVRNAMIFDDAETLIRAICSDPSCWGGADNVYSANSGQIETCYDNNGRSLLFVTSIPFSVIVS